MTIRSPQTWDPGFFFRSAIFEPLMPAASHLRHHADWPGRSDLERILTSSGVISGGGQALRPVAPPSQEGLSIGYEGRCFLTGQLETREKNWHDLFNALVWLTFPRSKAALNARHYLAQQSASMPNEKPQRGPDRDALTLFDECGVVVASTDASLLALLQGFAWKELFWRRREEVRSNMRVFIFGHGLYEQALQPFVGLTGKAVLLPIEESFLEHPPERQTALIDEALAGIIAAPSRLTHPREFSPLPVLGMPGWWTENRDESFYDNTNYFRPGRIKNRRIIK